MSYRYRYVSEGQAAVVHAWWRALAPESRAGGEATSGGDLPYVRSFDRGHRARLRRAVTLADMQREEAAYVLRARLGELKTPRLERDDQHWLFLVAGAVALVKTDAAPSISETKPHNAFGQSLPARLGEAAAAPGGSAPMSEQRFQRMLRADTPDSFYLQLRRALKLVNGPVDVAVLADDLLAWCAERQETPQRAYAMRYRWARDYFLGRKDREHASHDTASTPPPADFDQETTA